MGKIYPMVGLKFGQLTVISFSGKNNRRLFLWNCKCDCGKNKIISGSDLRTRHSVSCGCRVYKHGESDRKNSEYAIWCGMKDRCCNKNSTSFKHYGGRGISVHPSWMEYENFLRDMGRKPSPKHSIDRINNDGNYEPGNCRWATKIQQANNKRTNRIIIYNGEHLSIAELERKLNFNRGIIRGRLLKGWTFESAITTPHFLGKRMRRLMQPQS